MDLNNLLAALIGGLTAALPLLLYVSRKTKNTVDDRIAEVLEKLIGLAPAPAPEKADKVKEPLAPVD